MFRPAWQAVAEAAVVGDRTSLLDLGCGEGAFCAFAAEHGGRPLLNQTKGFMRSAAEQVWTPGWYALAKARQLEDPDGRFLTPFLRDLLPS